MNTTASAIQFIQAAPVNRAEGGEWWHPDMPDFEEGQEAEWKAWLEQQGLTTRTASLEDELMDHPAYVSYFDEGGSSFADWTPDAPEGEGWFTLCIGDTEDGPQWVWARREKGGA